MNRLRTFVALVSGLSLSLWFSPRLTTVLACLLVVGAVLQTLRAALCLRRELEKRIDALNARVNACAPLAGYFFDPGQALRAEAWRCFRARALAVQFERLDAIERLAAWLLSAEVRAKIERLARAESNESSIKAKKLLSSPSSFFVLLKQQLNGLVAGTFSSADNNIVVEKLDALL